MTKRTLHKYADAEDDNDTFEVYQKGNEWFWSFSPVWKDAGPFSTKEAAVKAGENFLDENGRPYIQ